MKTISALAAGVFTLAVVSSSALAAASRTFVSGAGTDTGSCALAAPCRTFAYALTQTSPNGEIIVLSSAGYGPVTISQSVSIINANNFAGVTVTGGEIGITINAGSNDSVILRGLTIDGSGTGGDGILFNSGGSLTVDQCNVINFFGSNQAGNGIFIQPSSGAHNIAITNTTVSNNTFGGVYVRTEGSAPATNVIIDHVTANNNGYGIALNSNTGTGGVTKVAISNSIGGFNVVNGFYFNKVTASLDASNATGNAASGVFVDGGALLAVL
jgi:hypothetical protein